MGLPWLSTGGMEWHIDMILGVDPASKEGDVREAMIGFGLACAACSGLEVVVPEPEVPNLSVVGYVTIDLDPAYGVVVLFDGFDHAIGSVVITAGRYGISRPVEAGTRLCDGYTVRAFVEDDFGPRQDTLELTADSGACTMPGDASIEHWLEFDLPARRSRDGG